MGIKHISRIDSDDTHGWFYRHYSGGKTFSKFFSDSRYGGKAQALDAAKKFRTAYEKKYPVLPRKPFHDKPPSHNTSGVVGVSETYTTVRGGSKEKVPCFTVSWCPEPNTTKIKKFIYRDELERDEAFKEAVAFRKSKEREMRRAWERQVKNLLGYIPTDLR